MFGRFPAKVGPEKAGYDLVSSMFGRFPAKVGPETFTNGSASTNDLAALKAAIKIASKITPRILGRNRAKTSDFL